MPMLQLLKKLLVRLSLLLVSLLVHIAFLSLFAIDSDLVMLHECRCFRRIRRIKKLDMKKVEIQNSQSQRSFRTMLVANVSVAVHDLVEFGALAEANLHSNIEL